MEIDIWKWNLAKRIALEGIAVASIGHRMSPATWKNPTLKSRIQHPEHVKDIAAAVSWLISHSIDYGIDPDLCIIGGYSSAGHLAALVTLDPQYLRAHGLSKEIFRGMIPISGTYDIHDYREVFLNGERPELAQLACGCCVWR